MNQRIIISLNPKAEFALDINWQSCMVSSAKYPKFNIQSLGIFLTAMLFMNSFDINVTFNGLCLLLLSFHIDKWFCKIYSYKVKYIEIYLMLTID